MILFIKLQIIYFHYNLYIKYYILIIHQFYIFKVFSNLFIIINIKKIMK